MGSHLQHVQRLTLRDAFDHVHQNHVPKLFQREVNSAASAHVAPAYNGYFLTHKLRIIASEFANSPVRKAPLEGGVQGWAVVVT